MLNRYRVVAGIGLWLSSGIACGGSSVHHLGDGGADAPGTADGPKPIDAPATSNTVTLVVTLDGAPAPGATVYFQNADSTVVAETQTGSDGTAAQTMTAGGFVTLLEPAAAEPTVAAVPNAQVLDTFAGVKPGDVLHVDVGTSTTTPVAISLSITAPTDPNGSAVNYNLLTTCGEASLASAVEMVARRAHPLDLAPTNIVLDNCNDVADMLVYSSSSNNTPLDSLYLPGVAVANGSAVTLSGSYVPMGTQTYDDIHIPLAVPDLTDQAHHLVGPHGLLFDLPQPGFDFGGGSAQLSYPQVAAPLVSIFVQEFEAGSNLPDTQTLVDWGSASFATVTVDATAERLPDYTSAPGFDTTHQQVQWTQQAAGSASVDAVYAQVGFSRGVPIGDDAGVQTATWSWNIIAPGTEAGAVQFPTVPTDVFAWNGAATDTITVETVEMGEATGGYDAVRANAIDEEFDTELDTSTGSGHVAFDYFAGPEALDVAPAVATHLRARARTRRRAR